MEKVIVVGAGIGGLSTAVSLASKGFDVTVLESHVYPGGCAGTYYHQGYRFDVGATLAGGFYPGGPMERLAKVAGIIDWQGRASEDVMGVLMTSGDYIIRWNNEKRHDARREVFGRSSDEFWSWQEKTADVLWDFAMKLPSWPPQSARQAVGLIRDLGYLVEKSGYKVLSTDFIKDAFGPLSVHLPDGNVKLRQFVDAQLLISAQSTSPQANALYAASALDLPRREVLNLAGGIGSIAEKLVSAIKHLGGNVLYRQRVEKVNYRHGKPVSVDTKRGDRFEFDTIVLNMTPWNVARLLGEQAPAKIRKLPRQPQNGWGAYVLYLGVDGNVIPKSLPNHNQIITSEPFGDGNAVFISISPEWDPTRAPSGKRAITISTHTNFVNWWDLYENDLQDYEATKEIFADKIFDAVELLIPGVKEASELVLPGTPITFERFTNRAWGWVGGFPQTNLFNTWGPRLAKGLWLVGDSIFPGQSIAATALGGMRVARDMEAELKGSSVRNLDLEYQSVGD